MKPIPTVLSTSSPLTLPDKYYFSTSSFHTLWIKCLCWLFKQPLDPSVQLHCCRKHSYKASGSISGLTLQGREPSVFEDLSRVSISYHSYCGHSLVTWGLGAMVFQLLRAKHWGGREHGHLQQSMQIASWLRALQRAPSRLKCQYTQLRTSLSLLLSPRFQLKMPDLREPCCSLPNCCFPTRMMRVCFTCPEAAWIVLEDCPG